ncbi:hypothetical protein QBC44DRAFT_388955 [Cladorrhinum sp. PSN332]|nr:hypothetical protein QBC44DRAFT_388955 [Cladorrhinum sp. PSN332]
MYPTIRHSLLSFSFSLLLLPLPIHASSQIYQTTPYNPSSLFPLHLPPPLQTCPLPSNPNPWSLQPLCPQPHCIFTSLPFRSSQGISLITLPHLAASLIPTLSHPYIPPSTVPWEITPLPGRGLGLLAKTKIKKHDQIMFGFPVLVVRLDFINGGRYTSKQKRRMLEEAVDRLGEEMKGKVLGLARSPEAGRNERDGPILDILKTNGFGVDVDGVQHLGLFVEGSEIISAFWRYVGSQMAMEVVALRNIQPGEEIAHSYAPLGYTHEERKAVLRQWGFQCRCALCSAPPVERQLADSRRERILEIHQILSKASDMQNTRRVDELVREATTLIELEELHPQFVEYYQQFAKAYMMINELKKAREYVKMADEMWLFYGGEEHENVEGMKELWAMLEEAEREAEDD